MDDKIKKHNNLCHWCRKSKNRIYINKIKYTDCNFCKQTYCNICIKRLPEITPNNEGCISCKKICSCFPGNNNNLNKCYKTRRNILSKNKNLKKDINKSISKPITKSITNESLNFFNTSSLQLNISDKEKRKFFSSDSVFDIESVYIVDSSHNLYLKPHKKRRLINIINIVD